MNSTDIIQITRWTIEKKTNATQKVQQDGLYESEIKFFIKSKFKRRDKHVQPKFCCQYEDNDSPSSYADYIWKAKGMSSKR